MKISAANAAFFQNRFKAVLHGAWFYRFVSSRKNIARPSVLFQNIQDNAGSGISLTEVLLLGEVTMIAVLPLLDLSGTR